MSILNYYLEAQKLESWHKKFQSTSFSQSGKTFSIINTNYRNLTAFFAEAKAFNDLTGIDRNAWNKKQPSGQESDKHRIINLINAGFYKQEEGKYFITPKGQTLLDLADDEKLNDDEKWLLLFLLLLDYRSEKREFDLFLTTRETFDCIKKAGPSYEQISDMLWDAIGIKTKKDLFNTKIFWYITFAKDALFIDKVFSATNDEILQLGEYVFQKSRLKVKSNNYLEKDCIGHKFESGGAYSKTTFIDDMKMLYFLHFIDTNKFIDFNDYMLTIFNKYSQIFISCNKLNISAFVVSHRSIFSSLYNKVLEFK